MHFGLTDEQAVLQETARRFAVEEVAPIAAQYDQSGEFPRALIQKAWELGLSSTAIPPEYGGVGLPSVDTCILTEEVAWGCSGIGTSIMCNDLGLMPIILAGSQEQKRKWLTPCTDEFTLISFCLSEPEAGSDVAGLQLQAEKDGDAYRLSGTKCWITNGGEANLYTVFATLDRSSRHKGICAFVVPADTPGISLGKKEDKMGQRASDTRVIHFDGVRVPASQRLGAEGEGFKIAMRTLDRTRPPIAALATGIARRALEESVQYARERKAFGQPIGGFQAVQFMLADMAKEIEASRLLTMQSAWMIDQGLACGRRSTRPSPSATRPTRRCESPPTPSRSSAATAIPRSTRSRSSCATPS
jgi:acyl-CoA dehydrogenase